MGRATPRLSGRKPGQRHELLVRRLRTGLPIVLLSVVLFVIADVFVGLAGNYSLLAVQGSQIVVVLAVLASLRTRAGQARAESLALWTVCFLYAATGAAAVVSGGPVAMALLFILLSMGTATLLPWGARAQLISVLVASGATAVSVALAQNEPGAAVVYETVAMLVGFVASVHIAGEFDRYRTTIEERTQALGEAQQLANVGNWEWVIDRNEIRWSDQLYRIFGRAPQEFRATFEAFLELVHPEDRERVRDIVANALTTLESFSFDHRIVRTDGTVRVLHALGEVEAGEDGRAARMFGTGQDITERKEGEEEVARARDAALEASALKSAFLANTSHEIRTPLNIILGYSEMIKEHLDQIGDPTLGEFLEGIHRAGQRLLDTIHGILDFSKMESGAFRIRPRALEIGSILSHHVEDCGAIARSKGLVLSLENEQPQAVLWFDEYCLSSAVLNLLQNAIKFTREGSISVRLFRDPGGSLSLSIRDTGIGMDSAFRRRLFEPFSQEDSGYTRQFEGSGLGLALTRKYLVLNGADIRVESEKGKGSTFTIQFSRQSELPAREARARAVG